MSNLLSSICLCALTIGIAVHDAETKRLGGSRAWVIGGIPQLN